MHDLLQPAGWKRPSGYSNAVAAEGRTLYLAGQIGWTGDEIFETEDFAGQVEQALRNIVAILAEAGTGPESLVRMTWYVTDKQEYRACLDEVGAAYRRVIGQVYPAMTLVEVAALLEDTAKVEIEATAVIAAP